MRVTRVRQKAGREERKERRKGRGKTGERRAGTGSAEGHTLLGKQPGLSRGAEAGGWSRGVPGSLPAERGTRQQAEPSGRSCPAHITSSHKITSLCQHHCSTSLVLLQQHQQRVGRGVWGVGTTESTFLHLRANTSRGADGSLAASIPQLPGLQAEGRVQLLRDCGHKSWVVCRTQSRQEGKGCPAEPGTPCKPPRKRRVQRS